MQILIHCARCDAPLEGEADFYGKYKIQPCQCVGELVEELQEEIADLEKMFVDKDREIINLESRIGYLEEETDGQQTTIDDLEAKIAKLKSAIDDKLDF